MPAYLQFLATRKKELRPPRWLSTWPAEAKYQAASLVRPNEPSEGKDRFAVPDFCSLKQLDLELAKFECAAGLLLYRWRVLAWRFLETELAALLVAL